MSADAREDILARVFTIMGSVPGMQTAVRNRALRANDERPCMVLLDGDETPRLSVDNRRIKGRAGLMLPEIVQLRPQIFILLKEDRPNNDQIGQEINAFRIAFMKLLWEDTTLASILGSNGSMYYYGCETDMKSGSAFSGQMRMDFIINYVLKPTG
jgi:hypothetical protein